MQKLSFEEIANTAKVESCPKKQKRLINKLYRAQDSKQGLPEFNNEFSVADRAIKRASRWFSESKVEFHPRSYAEQVHMEIRSVISDAWNRV